jgi:hypothetical protein
VARASLLGEKPMMIKGKKYTLLAVITFLLASSCSISQQQLPVPTSGESPIPDTATPTFFQPSSTTTITPTVEPTRTPTITPTFLIPTWTPLPTLFPDAARSMVTELLNSNGGCRLPCWWGIEPGKTSWVEARHFLQQFAIAIGGIQGESENEWYITVKVPPPYHQIDTDWIGITYIDQNYYVNDGIIEAIEPYNFDLSPNYYLPEFLEQYGEPSEVWISTFREEEQNSQPFFIFIFYQDQGILMLYGGGDITDREDHLRNCLRDITSPSIYLWSPDKNLTFEEAIGRFIHDDPESLPPPVPLEEATGVSVRFFYEEIINDGFICVETPKELWP